jgi:hypothetical protein
LPFVSREAEDPRLRLPQRTALLCTSTTVRLESRNATHINIASPIACLIPHLTSLNPISRALPPCVSVMLTQDPPPRSRPLPASDRPHARNLANPRNKREPLLRSTIISKRGRRAVLHHWGASNVFSIYTVVLSSDDLCPSPSRLEVLHPHIQSNYRHSFNYKLDSIDVPSISFISQRSGNPGHTRASLPHNKSRSRVSLCANSSFRSIFVLCASRATQSVPKSTSSFSPGR